MEKGFHGIYPFLATPIDDKGKINTLVMKNLVKHLIEKGIHGLTPLGSTGELTYLDSKNKKEVIKSVVEAADGKVPVIAGVGAISSNIAIEDAKNAEDSGADGILAVLPTYFPVEKDAIIEYYEKIAEAVKCPVVLYNNPKFSKADLTPEIVLKLSQVENIKYFKDATSFTGRLITIMNEVGDNIKIFSSSAHIPVSVFMLGGVGWMAGPACLIPELCIDLYNLCMKKEYEKAIILQKKIWKLNAVFQKYTLAACIKAGLEMQGFEVGNPIHPQKTINKTGREEIALILKELKK